MSVWVALLRAVNVAGQGKLPNAKLLEACERAGFSDARTYIASGNVVFRSDGGEASVCSGLERGLKDITGSNVRVLVRSAPELKAAWRACPFVGAPGNRIGVLFLDEAPFGSIEDRCKGRTDEEIVVGAREVYIHFPTGMGQSRLRMAEMDRGTMRNLNTLERLVAMSEALGQP